MNVSRKEFIVASAAFAMARAGFADELGSADRPFGAGTNVLKPRIRWLLGRARVGFNGLRREVAAFREKWAGNKERLDYLRGMELALDGIEARAKNCAAECRRLADEEKDASRKATLLEMAKRCDHVPMNPARTFEEGVVNTKSKVCCGNLLWQSSLTLLAPED